MSKQSNKQTQNVKVVVNNRLGCCDKPKRKRKTKPKQEDPPMDDGGFPALNTPAQTRPSYSALPIRNTVYMPSTVQISPEGMMPPIPNYFERPYTNLVRTMEDFQDNIVKEWREFQQSMQPTISPTPQPELTMTDTQSLFDIAPQETAPSRRKQALTLQDTQTIYDVPTSSMRPSTPSTPTTPPTMMTPNVLEQEGLTTPPVSNLVSTFEQMGTPLQSQASPSSGKSVANERRQQLNSMNLTDLQNLYYSQREGGRGRGRPIENRAVLINRIIDIEVYGKNKF